MNYSRKPWRKVLYEDQEYEDNFTDKTFLRDLKTNINIKEIKIVEAAIAASIFVQQFLTVCLFCLIYIYLYNEWTTPNVIFNYSSAISFIGYVIYYTRNSNIAMIRQNLRTLITYLIFGKLFSPLLHTLTDTVSTDSIYTMAFLMLTTHLIFFDYGVNVAIISNSLSLSAAMFASICLSSRLASAHHAFVLITVAIESFVLFPMLRNNLKQHYIITVGLTLIVLIILYAISLNSVLFFIVLLFFMNLFCPMLFVRYQKYKENIYGPWDEAIIENAVNINDLIY